MEFKNFVFEKNNGVGTIMLNRPEKLNALTVQIWEEIDQILDIIEKDNEIRAVLLCGK